jgi:glycosyltransferase involved in cell wall biosynthesis
MWLFAVVNGRIIDDLGNSTSATYTRIHYLLRGLKDLGVDVDSISFDLREGRNISDITYNNALKTLVALRTMLRLIRHRPYVYFAYPHSLTTFQNRAVFKLCKQLHLNILLDLHDTIEQATVIGDGSYAVSEDIEIECMKNSSFIFSALDDLAWQQMRDAYSLPSVKMVPLQNAFEYSLIDQFHGPYKSVEGRFNICYVGGLSKNRGVDLLVEACLDLHQKYPHMRLYIFGSYGVGFPEDLKVIIEESTFISMREVPRNELPGSLKDIDLFVMPYKPQERYLSHGSPTKFFEYLGTGKPMVCTRCKCVNDIAGDRVEYASYSREGFRKAIESLINRPERREEMSRDLIEIRGSNTWSERSRSIYRAITNMP